MMKMYQYFRIWIRIRIRMFLGLLDPHPDPYQNVTYPEHCQHHFWPFQQPYMQLNASGPSI